MVIRRLASGARRDEGMTLVELMTASALLLVVVAAAWVALSSITKASDNVAARQVAVEDVRNTLNRTSAELRQAVEIVQGAGALDVANPRDCEFFADVDGDGRPELVKYVVVGTKLTRQVLHSPSASPTDTVMFTVADPTSTVAASLEPTFAASGKMFTYWSIASTSTGNVTEETNASPEDISSVEIRIVALAKSGQEAVTIDEKVWVKIRSVWSALN
jgi:prepilin-type N-terminal cleavage/methylation domain-containing protein